MFAGLKEGDVLDQYKWEDGSEYGSFKNWQSGKPSDGVPLSCTYLQTDKSQWGDVAPPCKQNYYTICEYSK